MQDLKVDGDINALLLFKNIYNCYTKSSHGELVFQGPVDLLESEDVFAKQIFRVLYMQQMLQCKKIKTSRKAQSSLTFVAFACVRLFGFKCLKLFIFILLAAGKYIVSLTKITVWWHVKEHFIYSFCVCLDTVPGGKGSDYLVIFLSLQSH